MKHTKVDTVETIRGRSLVEPIKLRVELDSRRPLGGTAARWGAFEIPFEDQGGNFCVVGALGMGKTVIIRLLMQSVLPLLGQPWKASISEEEVEALDARHATWDLIEQEHARRLLLDAIERRRLTAQTPEPVPVEPLAKVEERLWRPIRSLESALGFAALTLPFSFWATTSWTDPLHRFAACSVTFTAAALLSEALWQSPRDRRRNAATRLEGRQTGWLWGGMVAAPVLGSAVYWPLAEANRAALGSSSALLAGSAVLVASLASYLTSGKRVEEPSEASPVPSAPDWGPRRPHEPARYAGPRTWDPHRALIYDAKLEVLPQLHSMGLSDRVVVFNPFDARGSAWDICQDVREPATAKELAKILYPKSEHDSAPFFQDSGQALISGAMVALMHVRADRWTLRDVVVAFRSIESIKALLLSCEHTEHYVDQFLKAPKNAHNILASIASKLAPFEAVAALWSTAENKYSLTQWLREEKIIVLGNDDSYRASLDPLNKAIFQRAVELFLAKGKSETGRTWFFLDEIREAGNLDMLGRLMTKGRFAGASVVLGFQDVEGLRDAFGPKRAHEILAMCANKIVLRVESPETAKWAEEVFGNVETIEEKGSLSEGTSKSSSNTTTRGSGSSQSQGQSYGTSSSSSYSDAYGSSTGTTYTSAGAYEKVVRPAVLASEFLSLPPPTPDAIWGFYLTRQGASKAPLTDYERRLMQVDLKYPGVDPREPSGQHIRPWNREELIAMGLIKEKDDDADKPQPQPQPDPEPGHEVESNLPTPLDTELDPDLDPDLPDSIEPEWDDGP